MHRSSNEGKLGRARILPVILLVGLLACAGTSVLAEAVWDGGGPHPNWMTAENWAGDMLPAFGPLEDLRFGTAFTSGTTLYMNGSHAVRSVYLDANTPMVIHGDGVDRLITYGGIFRTANSGGRQEIAADVVLRGQDSRWVNESDANSLVFSGVLRGHGPLTLDGAGTIRLEGTTPNRLRGDLLLAGGRLELAKLGGAAFGPGRLTIGDGQGADILALLENEQIDDRSRVFLTSSGTLTMTERTETIDDLTVTGGQLVLDNSTLIVLDRAEFAGGQVSLPNDGFFRFTDVLKVAASDAGAVFTGGTVEMVGLEPVFRVADGLAEKDLSIGSVLSGTAGLVKTGKGLMELTGEEASLYPGLTLIRRGTLRLSESATPGGTEVGTEVLPRGCLELDDALVAGEPLILRGLGPAGMGALRGLGSVSAWTGPVTLYGGVGISAEDGAELVIEGIVSGNGGLRKSDAGVLTLAGDSANTYRGATRVLEGTLYANKPAGVTAIPGRLMIGGGQDESLVAILADGQMGRRSRVLVDAAGTLLIYDEAADTIRGLSLADGAVSVGTGRLAVRGPFQMTRGNASVASGGVLALGGTMRTRPADVAAVIAGGTLDLGGGTRKINVADGAAWADLAISSELTNGSLAKTGPGWLLLTGGNTYSGATTVAAGTLEIAGTMNPASPILVGGGARLTVNSQDPLANSIATTAGSTVSGAGQIASDLTIVDQAVLSPGNSPGTLTIQDLTLHGESILEFDLGPAGVIGQDINDLIVVTGDLVLDGVLNIRGLDGFNSGTYRLFNYGGTLTDNGLEVGSAPLGHRYEVDTTIAGQIDLHVHPEPATGAMILLGTAVLLRRRGRRQTNP